MNPDIRPHSNSLKAYERALKAFENFGKYLGHKTPESRLELARALWHELMNEELLDKYEDSKGAGKQSLDLRPEQIKSDLPRRKLNQSKKKKYS